MKTEFIPNNVFLDFPCGICGSYYELSFVTVALHLDDGTTISDVCPMCLEAGKTGLEERAKERIRLLGEKMERANQMLERIARIDHFPTLQEYRKAEDEAYAEAGFGTVEERENEDAELDPSAKQDPSEDPVEFLLGRKK